ncbi:sulfatase-like hydrolase/transferase [Halomicroarcula sp. F13]|uniref:Sulfatase-like hydrolase/transferase n=1 Tax=Haloarcula rubra TaxID=2487747 RepID=A0AAW4PW30_9EURY|nr:sulfatase-like hydrolase/transferase [Halomicroarcula rubra]MBX0325913.1 sulfatase-like hydrolase/transferase [Halomicroarcula rubra]
MPFLAIKGWYQKHQYFQDAKASKVLDYYRKWRKGRSSTAAYLHLSDLHAPVNPPEEYVENRGVDVSVPGLQNIGRYNTSFDEENPDCQYYREQKLQLHRAGLDYISEQISEIINEFKDDTLLIITGDHGEGLYEHQELDRSFTDSRPNYCLGHGGTPFDVIARVPLAILGPDNIQNNPNGGWPTLRDIPATILEQAIENPNAPGISLFKTIPESRSVICEGTRYGVERKAVYRGEEKVIRSETDDVTLTTKLSPNGEESVELSDSTVEELLAQLPDQWDNMQSTRKVSDITKKQLKSLGYR